MTVAAPEPQDPICPLCLRPIPAGARQSVHHLIPRLKGGAGGPTVRLHQACHDEIHAALSEAELARAWNTPEALRRHPQIARFVAWIARKPPDFAPRTLKSLRRRRKR
ncbi:MAG: HNH endonuclease [Pseudomonadota bacterium]